MNILFFLTPKSEVDCVYEDDNLREALNRMESRQFTTIPIINEKTGRYVGTLSEGDLLRDIAKREDTVLKLEEEKPVMKVKRKRDYRCVRASSDMEELVDSAMSQNFVPVVDDTGTFIGIITRKAILQRMVSTLQELQDETQEKKIS